MLQPRLSPSLRPVAEPVLVRSHRLTHRIPWFDWATPLQWLLLLDRCSLASASMNAPHQRVGNTTARTVLGHLYQIASPAFDRSDLPRVEKQAATPLAGTFTNAVHESPAGVSGRPFSHGRGRATCGPI